MFSLDFIGTKFKEKDSFQGYKNKESFCGDFGKLFEFDLKYYNQENVYPFIYKHSEKIYRSFISNSPHSIYAIYILQRCYENFIYDVNDYSLIDKKYMIPSLKYLYGIFQNIIPDDYVSIINNFFITLKTGSLKNKIITKMIKKEKRHKKLKVKKEKKRFEKNNDGFMRVKIKNQKRNII